MRALTFQAVFAFVILAAVSSAPLCAQSTWTVRNPLPTDDIFTRVIFGGGKFVAIGEAGAILTSTNGTDWVEQARIPGRPHLTQLVFGNDQYVALDSNGVSYTSPDGVAWTKRTSTGGTGTGLTYGNGTYLAISANNLFATSPDGITWTQRTTGTTLGGTSVTFGSGIFVAATNSNVYLTTTDGITWNARSFPTGDTVSHIIFGNNLFLARLSTWKVASSADAITWQVAPNPPALYGLGSANNILFGSSTDARLFKSTDGLTWTATGADGFVGSAAATIAYGQGIYVAYTSYSSGNHGHLALYSSPDASTWTGRSSAFNFDGTLAYGLGVFVAGNCVSSDGVNWAPGSFVQSLPRSYSSSTYRLYFAGSRFFAFSDTYWDSSYISTDAVTSTPIVGAYGYLTGVAYGGGTYVIVGQYGATFNTKDGISWTTVTSPGREDFTDLIYAQNQFVAATDTSAVVTSTDGTSWISHAVPVTSTALDQPAKIAYGSGKYVLLRSTGEAFTSTDAITWTAQPTLPFTAAALAFANGTFVATGTTGTLYTSTDGTSWTERESHASGKIEGLAFGNGQWVATANASSLIIQSDTTSGAAVAPVLVQQLSDRSIASDGTTTTTLMVTATGTGPFAYQWYRDGVAVSGATGQTYTITLPSVTANEAHNYRVTVTGPGGSISSNTAVITDLPAQAPFITSQPNDVKAPPHYSATFGVRALGIGGITYQWRKDGQPLAASPSHLNLKTNGPTLSLDNISLADAGIYDVVISNSGGTTVSRGARLTLDQSRLVNLSARARTSSGDDKLIAGFVIANDVGYAPQVNWRFLARAIGPGLSDKGVTGFLKNPSLDLHEIINGQPRLVTSNDTWDNYPEPQKSTYANLAASVGAFPLTAGSADAAVVQEGAQLSFNATPHVYTAQVSAPPNESGVALVEIYDTSFVHARLLNLSARGKVGSGDDVLIAGFVIQGTKPLTVLIRGVGPGLKAQGLSQPLANPKLTLFDHAGVAIHNNDNWNQARNLAELRAATTATGAFALTENSNDAAMLETLDPGVYTAHVTSVDGSSGVALVEIYEAP